MKKLLSLAVVLAIAGVAVAAPPSPVNVRRNQIGGAAPEFYSVARNSTASELVVCSGRCLLGAIILNTGAPTSNVAVRDTSVAGLAGNVKLIHAFSAINTEPGNNPIRLPMLFDNGISVKLSSASNGEEVAVEYLDLD